MSILKQLLQSHRIYWDMIGPLKRSATLAIGIASLAGFFELLTLFIITPLLGFDFGAKIGGQIGRYLDFFISSDVFGNPWFQFALLLFVVSLSIGARWLAFRCFVDLRFEVAVRLRKNFLDRLITMPWERYHGIAAGSITSSLNHAVWQIGEGIEQYLLVIANFVIVAVLLSFAFFLAPPLALIVVVFVALMVVASTLLSRRLKKETQESIQKTENAAIVSHQIFENLKYVRVSGILKWAREMCGLSYDHERSGHTRISRTNELHHFGLEFAGMALIGLLILTYRLSEGVGFGVFVVFIGLMYRSMPRIQALQAARLAAAARLPWINWWQGVEHSIGEVTVKERANVERPPGTKFRLEFENVSYAYPSALPNEDRKLVLRNLCFTIVPGNLLAVVGFSGAGKSTAVDLLSGLISPTSGRITIDGVDLENIDLAEWRQLIGYLPQEPLLFSGSVLSNVALADDEPNRTMAIASLKSAQAWEFVQSMPGGLDAQIGERGGRLSGGEKQRLALARAIYRQPKFLLLDEPTSALDESSTLKLGQVLKGLKQHMAIVMVTHSVSLLDIADEVINLTEQKELRTTQAEKRAAARAGGTAVASTILPPSNQIKTTSEHNR